MRIGRISRPRTISIIETEEPNIENPSDVKIKVAYSGVCPDELPFFRKDNDRLAWGSLVFPHAGHELAGIVTEAGEEALEAGFVPGTRVSGYAWKHCRQCYYCRSGRENLCINLTPSQSTLADYVVWDMHQLIELPDEISLAAGVLTDPIGFSLHGLDRSNMQLDSTVLIIGASAFGLILTQLCKLRGAKFVTLADPYLDNREIASKLGADYTIDNTSEAIAAHTLKATSNIGYDVIFEASGKLENLKIASKLLAKQGTLCYGSVYGFNQNLPITLSEMFIKEASLIPFHMAPYKLPMTKNIMKKLDLDPIITKEYPMEEATQAYIDTETGMYPHVVIKI